MSLSTYPVTLYCHYPLLTSLYTVNLALYHHGHFVLISSLSLSLSAVINDNTTTNTTAIITATATTPAPVD